MNTQANWIQECINNAKAANAAFAERLENSKGVMMGQGFVVQPHTCPGFVVSFETKDRVVTNPKVGTLLAGGYNMFTKEDAEKIAAGTFNGNQQPAQAIHIRDAWKEAIAANNETIAQMEKFLAA